MVVSNLDDLGADFTFLNFFEVLVAFAGQVASVERDLEQIVSSMGYKLWGVEFLGKSNLTLRVYIDNDVGITIEDCESVSHQVSRFFDVNQPALSDYTLEVSSPGLDRLLFTPQQYTSYIGKSIKVVFKKAFITRKRLVARLLNVDDNGVILCCDEIDWIEENQIHVKFSDIKSARVEPEFTN